MNTLLIAFDPEGCADLVASEAAALAADLRADAVLLTVVSLPDGVPGDATLHGGPREGLTARDVLHRDARDALAGLQVHFDARSVPTRIEVREGPIVDEVIAAARSHQPRYLVLGTHGRRGITRFFLGSVAEQILRQAPVPVLTVRARDSAHHPSANRDAVRAEADG